MRLNPEAKSAMSNWSNWLRGLTALCEVPNMKVLVQNPLTHFYLRSDGTWTTKSGEAHDFMSSVCALSFCMECLDGSFQIVLSFVDGGYDLSLLTIVIKQLGGDLLSHVSKAPSDYAPESSHPRSAAR